MTNHFACQFWKTLIVALLAGLVGMPGGRGGPPQVQPDLVIHYGNRQRGEAMTTPSNPSTLTLRRRNKRPVTFGIALNGDLTGATAPRRDVFVAISGPRKNRRASFRYFFESDNISGSIFTGAFSGYVDPGFNFDNLAVEVVPRKRKFRRKRNLGVVTVQAIDSETGKTTDSVRARLRRR